MFWRIHLESNFLAYYFIIGLFDRRRIGGSKRLLLLLPATA